MEDPWMYLGWASGESWLWGQGPDPALDPTRDPQRVPSDPD